MSNKREAATKRRKLLSALLLCFVLVCLSNWYALKMSRVLPEQKQFHPLLQQDPRQTETEHAPFVFTYEKKDYLVKPVADYELQGLIVSHNNISGIGDMYHTSSSVDFKDLCVIWGDNLQSAVYKGMEFWSEPWTCMTREKTPGAFADFNLSQISNNHLLTDNLKIRDLVRKATIGDQVRLRGWLVNYSAADNPGWSRDTSLLRTDTGNGACEVLFLRDFEILRRGNPRWHILRGVLTTLLWILSFVIPALFVYSAYADAR